jgi:hypothetical protein
MPKLYEYFGLAVFFYANEREAIRVHGAAAGHESSAELVMKEGKVARVVFRESAARPPLTGAHLKDFKKLVRAKAREILRRRVDYFVLKKRNVPKTFKRRIK